MTVRRPRPLTVVAAGVVGVVGVMAVLAAAFLVAGGRYFVVRTPSMGTAAPVGTLVLTRRTDIADVRVGDVIAFHPPTEPGATYTHRVVAVTPAGLRTRGDINGAADPWRVTSHDLVGRAVVLLPGVGWVLRALPFLVIGGVLVWWATRAFVTAVRRGPARLFGAALVFLVTVLVLRPFVGVAQLASSSDADGTSRVSVVSTGLLPVRLTPSGASAAAAPVDLDAAGRTGVSVLRGGTPGHRYHLTSALHLFWWQWVLAVAVVLSPVLWTFVVGFRPAPVSRRGVSHRAVTT